MFLHSIASAVPERSFTQQECWDVLKNTEAMSLLKPRSQSLLEKVLLGDGGITKRHFSLDEISEVVARDAEGLNRMFEKAGPKLSIEALGESLAEAGLKPRDLDSLIVCTCTGYLCPGLSSYIAEQIGLKQDAYLQDLVGLGCGAAIPALRAADAFIAANPTGKVAVVAVEICSAAFYVDDDPGVLISLSLFGDGASASIWSGAKTDWKAHNFDTIHVPEEREKIRFVNSGGQLKNKLHKTVPQLAGQAVKALFDRCELEQGKVLAHTGGRDVIEELERVLPECELTETRRVLANYGNISSPSVLFALEDYLNGDTNDKNLWLTAFGAGFAAHSMSLSRR